jgi:hypothetical protein
MMYLTKVILYVVAILMAIWFLLIGIVANSCDGDILIYGDGAVLCTEKHWRM